MREGDNSAELTLQRVLSSTEIICTFIFLDDTGTQLVLSSVISVLVVHPVNHNSNKVAVKGDTTRLYCLAGSDVEQEVDVSVSWYNNGNIMDGFPRISKFNLSEAS